MKLPRHISSTELIKKLQKLGYTITRQKESHVRLTITLYGERQVTIPNYNLVKPGTLSV